MQSCAALAGGEEPWDVGHLRIRIDAHTAHHVVRGWPDFHRFLRDVNVRQLLELMVHAGKFPFDVFRGIGNPFLNPRNVQEHASVGAATPFLHFSSDAAGHVIACKQFRRAARVLVSLCIAPAFFFRVSRLVRVRRRNVVKHETTALTVAQHASLASHSLGDQNSSDAWGPDHSRWMKLHELHIHQRRSRVVREGVPVAGVFPAVAGNLVGAANSACRQHYRLGAEYVESSAVAVVAECARYAVAIL